LTGSHGQPIGNIPKWKLQLAGKMKFPRGEDPSPAQAAGKISSLELPDALSPNLF